MVGPQESPTRVATDVNSEIAYADMNDGSWAIIVQSPEHDFVNQREFNLTAGGSANLVIVTVSLSGRRRTALFDTRAAETAWIPETETVYADPYIVTDDCYYETETVIHYIPGPTTYYISTVSRWSTVGAQTQYYQTTITKWAYCHWPTTTREPPRPTTTTHRTFTIRPTTRRETTTSRRSTRPPITTIVNYDNHAATNYEADNLTASDYDNHAATNYEADDLAASCDYCPTHNYETSGSAHNTADDNSAGSNSPPQDKPPDKLPSPNPQQGVFSQPPFAAVVEEEEEVVVGVSNPQPGAQRLNNSNLLPAGQLNLNLPRAASSRLPYVVVGVEAAEVAVSSRRPDVPQPSNNNPPPGEQLSPNQRQVGSSRLPSEEAAVGVVEAVVNNLQHAKPPRSSNNSLPHAGRHNSSPQPVVSSPPRSGVGVEVEVGVEVVEEVVVNSPLPDAQHSNRSQRQDRAGRSPRRLARSGAEVAVEVVEAGVNNPRLEEQHNNNLSRLLDREAVEAVEVAVVAVVAVVDNSRLRGERRSSNPSLLLDKAVAAAAGEVGEVGEEIPDQEEAEGHNLPVEQLVAVVAAEGPSLQGEVEVEVGDNSRLLDREAVEEAGEVVVERSQQGAAVAVEEAAAAAAEEEEEEEEEEEVVVVVVVVAVVVVAPADPTMLRTPSRPLRSLKPLIPSLSVTRRVRANDVTSTVYESFTITETVVEVEEGEPFTEINYYTETETYFPPDQTVCYAETTETHFYQGPPVTKWDVNYVTYYTFNTIWVG
ncbi:hypothetical protein OQA88_2660 [Cercophora sp. LCS_1]